MGHGTRAGALLELGVWRLALLGAPLLGALWLLGGLLAAAGRRLAGPAPGA